MELDNLNTFVSRLNKIGISMEISFNYPWTYIDSINGIKVTERFDSEHDFVLGYTPIRRNDNKFKFSDLAEIFKLIRKYKNELKK